MKPLFCALALVTMLAPAMAQTDAAPKQAQTQDAPESVKLDNGLVVTTVVLPYSELENMMGVNVWRFLVQPPAPDTSFSSRMQLRVRMPGKNPQDFELGLGGNGNISHDVEVTVGLLPDGGYSLTSAAKWKSAIHTREFVGERTINNGTDFGSRDNPTKDMENVISSTAGSSPYVTPVTVSPNGEVTLMTFSSGPADKRIDSKLVLIFQSESNAAKK